jgi:hypothetical protein
MAYQITLESSWTHTLTGKRLPKSERRATLESAEARALHWINVMGTGLEPTRTTHHDGSIYLDGGPTFGVWIEAAA